MFEQRAFINNNPSPIWLEIIHGEPNKPRAIAQVWANLPRREMGSEKYDPVFRKGAICPLCHKGFEENELIWHEFMFLNPENRTNNPHFQNIYHYHCVNIVDNIRNFTKDWDNAIYEAYKNYR